MDKESSNTIMSRNTWKELCKEERIPEIQVCECKLITLGGPCSL